MYMENVLALLGGKTEMKRVMHYLIQEFCLRGKISIANQVHRIHRESKAFNHLPCIHCSLSIIAVDGASDWRPDMMQETSKRGLTLSWAKVSLQNVGLAAT